MSDLKPCPRCQTLPAMGGLWFYDDVGNKLRHPAIRCLTCHYWFYIGEDEAETRERWNEREGITYITALLERASELVHHDTDCAAILGLGDEDCTCDAVPFLKDLEAALRRPTPPSDVAKLAEELATAWVSGEIADDPIVFAKTCIDAALRDAPLHCRCLEIIDRWIRTSRSSGIDECLAEVPVLRSLREAIAASQDAPSAPPSDDVERIVAWLREYDSDAESWPQALALRIERGDWRNSAALQVKP